MTALEHLATVRAHLARREAEVAWENVSPEIRLLFTDRLLDRLPDTDPEGEWSRISVRGRQDMLWHLTRTPAEHRAAWEDEEHRLRMLADDETAAAFKALVELERAHRD